MIRIQTEDGPVDVDAQAKDVTVEHHHLKIKRDGVLVAQFRKWQHWHETTEGEQS